jgi:hypothetical protein
VATTTVTSCADSPSTGRSAPCTFTVTVQDTEAPVITCSAPIVVDAVSPEGAAVAFTPSASDNCAVTTLTSTPPSGSVFAIGTTTVTSATTDPAGNAASCSFTIHVKSAAEQTADLVAAVDALVIKAGIKNALLVKLDAALAALAASHTAAACGELMAFINLVEAQAGKAISGSDAAALIDAATRIRAVIGC